MAANTPKTLLDVPECVLAKHVYGRLGVEDRKSLSLTCKRLRKVAIDGAVFSDTHTWELLADAVLDGEDIVSEHINDESFKATQLFRARSLSFKSEAHTQLFLERYAELPPDARWHVRNLWMEYGNPDTPIGPLTTPLSTTLPRLQRLTISVAANAPHDAQLDTQHVLADLTRCTELCLNATIAVGGHRCSPCNWRLASSPKCRASALSR